MTVNSSCDVHKVKFYAPYVDGADVVRSGECVNCKQRIEVVYGYAGAFIKGNKDEEVAYEEVSWLSPTAEVNDK